jgi:hypothetical protein
MHKKSNSLIRDTPIKLHLIIFDSHFYFTIKFYLQFPKWSFHRLLSHPKPPSPPLRLNLKMLPLYCPKLQLLVLQTTLSQHPLSGEYGGSCHGGVIFDVKSGPTSLIKRTALVCMDDMAMSLLCFVFIRKKQSFCLRSKATCLIYCSRGSHASSKFCPNENYF